MRVLRDAGVVVAATIGAGIFALPYIFVKSGFWVSIFYLVALSGIIIFAHLLYWRVLDSVGERERLLGLTRTYLGPLGYFFGMVAIVAGLTFALVAYLILGGRFIRIFLPSLGESYALLLFWMFAAIPLLLKEKKIVALESLGSLGVAAIIFFIFMSNGLGEFSPSPVLSLSTIFLPFGALLFSLAGWPAIEPLYASYKREAQAMSFWKISLPLGTIFAGALYLMFVSGILAGSSTVTPDTISGFLGAPGLQKFILATLGIFAVWNSYKPIGLEIKNALEKDLRWRPGLGLAFVILAPLVLILLGMNSFLGVLGFSGGVFVSLEYLLILLVARRALALTRPQNFFLSAAALVFVFGAIYEVYYFVVG